MRNALNAWMSGLVGTVVMTAMMMMKKAMGVMPDLDPISMMSGMAGDMLGMSLGPGLGWVMHFMIGTLAWGTVFGLLRSRLPAGPPGGVIVAVGAWFMMMIAVMPMAGAGLFGLGFGPMAPVATLMMHVAYGASMGFAWDRVSQVGSSETLASA